MKKILYVIIIAMSICCASGCSKNTVPQSSTIVPETTRSSEAENTSKSSGVMSRDK